MEGKRHDVLMEDDASFEILPESGDSHTRDSEWSIHSPGGTSIAGSMVDFHDFDDGGLPYSAEFYLNDEASSQQNRTTSDSFSSGLDINCLDNSNDFGNECDQIETTLLQIMDMNVSSDQLSKFSVEVFSTTVLISCCMNKFPRKHFGTECDQIKTTLKQINCAAMDMNVSSDELSNFSGEFVQLLNDLGDLQLEWFVQLTPSDKRSHLLRAYFIYPVDSICKDSGYECFKVVDFEGFIELYKLLQNSEEIPKHYQLKVIQVLLQTLEKLASKQSWNDKKHPSDKDLLGAMIVMINSIRRSLVLLNEQPDHFCFEKFLLKMSKPCAQVIKEEVQDLPHIDTIDYEESLDPLLDRFESSISKVLLINGLKIYTTQYNKYITESAQLSRENRIEHIVSDVKTKMNQIIKLAKSWSEEFKRNVLPEIIAGLSVVWSIIVSENDSSSEKMTKPSLLQISCIFSIFGDQKNHNPDDSHRLLQLSSQEGKEFVLGLTAAVLALHGHKIQIVCLNSHLTRMYSLDWIRVFRRFSIFSNISYESVQDMAMERSKEVYEKYLAYINDCFGFEPDPNNDNELKNASEDERSILLIEDIDIILQKFTMHLPFYRLVKLFIPGLKEVQRKLFCQKVEYIDQIIKHSINANIMKLRAFLDRPQSYKIFEHNEAVEYTNKTLFLKQLDAMKKGCNRDREYFKFGYISIAYPDVVKSFPLVLGFTAAPLEENYKTILNDVYGIHNTISESDIFQTIPTKFDSKKDFLYFDSTVERDWMEAMLAAIQAAIDRNCLVLVFLNDAQEMKQLQQTEYLKQLNVTALKTANLSMPNSSNEIHLLRVFSGHFSKDRQVHVIQTFFSDDPKKEDLIRRQAERSHCSGSYELIFHRTVGRAVEKNYDWFVGKRQHSSAEKIKRTAAMELDNYNKIKKFFKVIN